jgi:HEAT repeat protein
VIVLQAACGGREEYRATIDLGPDIRALASDDLDESSQAADRIVMAGAGALPALEAAFRTEPPGVRREVIAVAARIEDAGAVRLLSTAAGDPDAEMRYEALVALGTRAAPGAFGVVESALDDGEAKVRMAAAAACVAHCASPTALARLVDVAVNDPPLPNAIAARSAIVRILADPARADALRAAIQARVAPVLARRAERDATVRAALLASDVGDPAGREVLAGAARGDVAPALRLQAIHALGTVGDAEAVPVLTTLAGQPAFGEYACDAVRRIAARGIAGATDALANWRGACPPAALPPPAGAR